MTCPDCGGEMIQTPRSRRTQAVIRGATYREHHCPRCRRTFISEQRLLTSRTAEQALDRIERWDGSQPMPNGSA